MMTFGYILFSFFISIADGAYGDIIQKFIQERTGHIQVHREGYLDTPRLTKSIKGYQEIRNQLKGEDVRGISARIRGAALAFGEKKSLGVQIVGIEPDVETNVTTIKKRVNVGSYLDSDSKVVIGKKISEVLKVEVGDTFIMISQGADGSIANDIFEIGGIIAPKGEGIDDSTVYMTIPRAQEFLTLYGRVHELAIALDGADEVELTEKINRILPKELVANSWQDVEKDFYRAMQADRKGDVIGRMIFMIVIAIGVLNTILMSILERKREFGVLKAIGTRPTGIFGLITLETAMMSSISIIIGFFLALGLNYYFSIVGIPMDAFEYGGMRFDKMVATLNLRCFIIPLFTILGSSLFVSVFPAIKAARVTPVDAMRDI
jgi:putative ABC transport system permease protein